MTERCTVDGCSNARDTREWCRKHYTRWQRHGDPLRIKNRERLPSGPRSYAHLSVNGKAQAIHILIAEKAIGRELSKGEIVHHANGNRLDNRNANLVICPDRAYHNLLHTRLRAWQECGDPNRRKCAFCGQYDDVNNLTAYRKQRRVASSTATNHRSCRNADLRSKRLRISP